MVVLQQGEPGFVSVHVGSRYRRNRHCAVDCCCTFQNFKLNQLLPLLLVFVLVLGLVLALVLVLLLLLLLLVPVLVLVLLCLLCVPRSSCFDVEIRLRWGAAFVELRAFKQPLHRHDGS